MNQSTSFPNVKPFRAKIRHAPTGFLMYAFKLPSNNPRISLPRSQWNGKSVCQPRTVLATQYFGVATVRRKLRALSQTTGDTDPDSGNADLDRSIPQSEEDVSVIRSPVVLKPTSIWLFVVENAVQVIILALAIAGSIHTRRRFLVHLVALLSVPQFALIVSRIWRQSRVPIQPVLASTASPVLVEDSELVSSDEGRAPISDVADEAPVSEPVLSRITKEYQKDELSLAQSKLISTSIRNVVAEEVGSLRYAIEQIEQTTEERQQARNLVIAEAIASLDGSLRSLRRSVDTRKQVENSAPFALVSELEIVKSRLKQAEQEKMELEVRLRAAEDNFEEAKRQGERARREANEANSRELTLRTELAVASSRLVRLEEVTERLDRAERRNDGLQEQLINGTREKEGLRQSAEDAARRVVRVENVAKILREKIQELSGKSLSRFVQEGGDLFGDAKEQSDNQLWPQLLRNKGDLSPDSVIYQELHQEEKGLRSTQWPRDPLGTEGIREDRAQLQKLPDDGGFGVKNTSNGPNASDGSSTNKLLSAEGPNDTIFSFSRGEFDDSGLRKEREMPSDENAKSLEESSKTPVELSKVVNASEDSVSEAKQSQHGSEDNASPSGYQVEKPSKLSTTEVVELTGEALGEASKSSVETEASKSGQYKPNKADTIILPALVEDSDKEKDKKEDKDCLTRNNVPPASAESASKEELEKQDEGLPNTTDEKQDEGPSEMAGEEQDGPSETRAQAAEKKPEAFQESVDPVELDTTTRHGIANQHAVAAHIAYIPDKEAQKDDQSLPAESIISVESTSDPSRRGTATELSVSSDEEVVEHPSPKTAAVANVSEVMAAEQRDAPHLESLRGKEQSKPVETVQDQLITAAELVKKARTRGLAVKQADLLFQKATKKLENALEQADDRTEVEAELGGCLLAWAKTNIADPSSQERLLRALEFLTSSVESQADNQTILFNTGLCLCLVASTSNTQKALGDYQKACSMYERLLELNDNSRMACFNCGLAYVSLGRLSLANEGSEKSRGYFERACGLFQRSLELKPGDSKAISYLDDCRRQLREL